MKIPYLMQKKYFIRRIPEEGEIKVGDYIRSQSSSRPAVKVTEIEPNGDFVTDERETADPLGEYYYVVPKNEAVKISSWFHVCTNDVRPGDMVFVNPDAEGGFHKGIRMKVLELEDLGNDYIQAKLEYVENPYRSDTVGRTLDWPAQNVWKSVGPASSKAKWLKEYTTVELSQIQLVVRNWQPEGCLLDPGFAGPTAEEVLCVRLQCDKCESFH